MSSLLLSLWDIGLSISNSITPAKSEGKVTPEGHPGFGGKWPDFVPPKEGDSRCSCPALNALANHGILPHDGKNIPFKAITDHVRTTYNFAPTFCYNAPKSVADFLNKDYNKDTLNLEEIDFHNGIEHDASFCRTDTALCPDQSKIQHEQIKELLASATGKDKDGNSLLTVNDLSEFSAKRRVEARETNPDFTLASDHRMIGSANAAALLSIFGGRVQDLEPFLLDERIPEGWESKSRCRFGLTLIQIFFSKVLWIEKGIDEKKYIEKKKAAAAVAAPASADTNESNQENRT